MAKATRPTEYKRKEMDDHDNRPVSREDDEILTPEDEAEEFDDTDTADLSRAESEKADPDDRRNSP
jgi:hypothetical protein